MSIRPVGAERDAADRRAFVNSETDTLGQFIAEFDAYGDPLPRLIVAWRREYRCECGYKTSSPGSIFDHTKAERP